MGGRELRGSDVTSGYYKPISKTCSTHFHLKFWQREGTGSGRGRGLLCVCVRPNGKNSYFLVFLEGNREKGRIVGGEGGEPSSCSGKWTNSCQNWLLLPKTAADKGLNCILERVGTIDCWQREGRQGGEGDATLLASYTRWSFAYEMLVDKRKAEKFTQRRAALPVCQVDMLRTKWKGNRSAN